MDLGNSSHIENCFIRCSDDFAMLRFYQKKARRINSVRKKRRGGEGGGHCFQYFSKLQ